MKNGCTREGTTGEKSYSDLTAWRIIREVKNTAKQFDIVGDPLAEFHPTKVGTFSQELLIATISSKVPRRIRRQAPSLVLLVARRIVLSAGVRYE